jgi:release factor glutamine methyltransferase
MIIQSLLQNPNYKEKRVLENLICHFQKLEREQLRTSLDFEIPKNTMLQINKAYDDFVIQKKPLEYVLGYVEFMRNQFKIDGRALIPRPETEYMIQAVNENVATLKRLNGATLFDIGTGCGVLGLSVLLHNPDFFDEAYLSEYINETLSLAVENYETFKPRL